MVQFRGDCALRTNASVNVTGSGRWHALHADDPTVFAAPHDEQVV
jgi:hypothetical protein